MRPWDTTFREKPERLSLEAWHRVLAYARGQYSVDQLLTVAGSMSRVEATEMQPMLEREFGRIESSN